MMINIKMTPYFATGFVVVPIMYEGMLATLKQIDHNITDDIKTVTNTNVTVLVKFYIPLVFPSMRYPESRIPKFSPAIRTLRSA